MADVLDTLVVKLVGDAAKLAQVLKQAQQMMGVHIQKVNQQAKQAQAAHNAMMAEGARITASVATPTEQYRKELSHLKMLLKEGAINQQTYNRAVEEARKLLPSVIAENKKLTDMHHRANAEAMRATQITNQLATTQERYKSGVAELNHLLKQGLITQATYNRGMMQLNAMLPKTRGMGSYLAAGLGGAYRSVSGVMGGIGNAASSLGMVGGLVSSMTALPLAAFAKSSVHAFSEFDKAMTKSLSIAGNVSHGLRTELEKTAKVMATQGVHSAIEVAEAYYQMVSAGFSVQQTIKSIGVVSKFATAGMMNLEQSVKMLAKATFSMYDVVGKSGEEVEQIMKHVGDVLAQGANMVLAEIPELTEALTNAAAPAAKLLDMTIEETVAALQIYIQKGSSMATASEHLAIGLRLTQQAFSSQSDAWIRMGKAMGINMNIYDRLTGKIKPFADIVDMLSKALGHLSDRERTLALEKLGFHALHQRAILPLIGTADQIRENTKALKKHGEMERIAEVQLTSFSASIKKLQNQWENLKIEIGQRIAPEITRLSGIFKGFMAYLNGSSGAILDSVSSYSTLALKITACATAASGFLFVLPQLVRGLTMMLSPHGLIIVGAGLLLEKLFDIRKEVQQLTTAIKGELESMMAVSGLRSEARAVTAKEYGEKVAQMMDKQIQAQDLVEKKRKQLEEARERAKPGRWQYIKWSLGGMEMPEINARSEEMVNRNPEVGVAKGELESAARNSRAITEQIERAKKGVDAAKEFYKAFTGGPSNPSLSFYKAYTGNLTTFVGHIKKANEEIESSVKSAEDKFSDFTDKLEEMKKKFRKQIFIHEQEQKQGAVLSGAQREILDWYFDMLEKTQEGVDELQKKVNELSTHFDENSDVMKRARRELEEYQKRVKQATDAGLKEAHELADRVKAQEKEREELQKLKSLEQQYENPHKKHADQLARINKLYKEGKLDLWGYTKAIKDANKELQAQDETAKKIRDTMAVGHKFEAMKWDRTEIAARIAQQNAELAMHGVNVASLGFQSSKGPKPKISEGRLQHLKQIEYARALQTQIDRHLRAMARNPNDAAYLQERHETRVKELSRRYAARSPGGRIRTSVAMQTFDTSRKKKQVDLLQQIANNTARTAKGKGGANLKVAGLAGG